MNFTNYNKNKMEYMAQNCNFRKMTPTTGVALMMCGRNMDYSEAIQITKYMLS